MSDLSALHAGLDWPGQALPQTMPPLVSYSDTSPHCTTFSYHPFQHVRLSALPGCCIVFALFVWCFSTFTASEAGAHDLACLLPSTVIC